MTDPKPPKTPDPDNDGERFIPDIPDEPDAETKHIEEDGEPLGGNFA